MSAHDTEKPIITENVAFEFVGYDLFQGVQENLHNRLTEISRQLGLPRMASPLITIVGEMANYALKSIYKEVFFKYVIQEVHMDSLPEEEWLRIFHSEMDTNRADNFAHICREKKIAIVIRGYINNEFYRFEVVHPGALEAGEQKRLNERYRVLKGVNNFAELLEGEFENALEESDLEMGLALIIMTLKGLGIALRNFRMHIKRNETVMALDVPLELFRGRQSGKIDLLPPGTRDGVGDMVLDLVEQLNYHVLLFSPDGSILKVQPSFLEEISLPADDIDRLPSLIKARFYEDIFHGPFSVNSTGEFTNYRIYIPIDQGKKKLLFNVSGILKGADLVFTLWQKVHLNDKEQDLAEGSMFENVYIQQLIAPYIPGMVLEKAHQVLRQGLTAVPNEVKDVTILFADLVGFTHMSEHMSHHDVIDLLNLAMGIVARAIEKHAGKIDKFMGDGVMAIFHEPLSAVVAAVETQRNFIELNEFRAIKDESPIEIRIGINSGIAILGSIGTNRRKDWTALGDMVNTASRIEKLSRPNSVMISSSTYEKVKDHVRVSETFRQKVKGKSSSLELMFVEQVNFLVSGRSVTLGLEEAEPFKSDS